MVWNGTKTHGLCAQRAQQGCACETNCSIAAPLSPITKENRERRFTRLEASQGVQLIGGFGRISAQRALILAEDSEIIFSPGPTRLESGEFVLRNEGTLRYDLTTERSYLSGRTHIKDSAAQLEADSLWLQLGIEPGTGRHRVETINAEGNILLVWGEERITAQNGQYDRAQSIIRLCGSAVLERQRMRLAGECAFVDLEERVSRMQGTDQNPVRAILETQTP